MVRVLRLEAPLMCDHAPNRERAMVLIKPGVWCDPCLEPLVRALNDGGLQTIASCCGHGRRPASVVLADGRVVAVFDSLDDEALATSTWPGINGEPARAGSVH